MADNADRASELIDQDHAEALAKHQSAVERERRIAESRKPATADEPLRCEDCNEPISTERLAILSFASRCTGCSSVAEQAYRKKGTS